MSAKKSYSDDATGTPDRYSDHFESDDENKISKQNGTTAPKKTSGKKNSSRGRRRGSDGVRGGVPGQGLRKGQGNSRRTSHTSEPVDMKQNHDSFTTRVLSASRNRINELRNKVEELKIKIKELEQENKMFKTLQFRHEKTIRNIKDKESDLPMILDKHNNEIRSLREQNRRLREKYEKSDRFLRDAEDELEKVKKKMKKFRELVEDKDLLERDELSRRIAKVEPEIEEKEMKIKGLEKHIKMLKKNHAHEMGIEIARQKDVKKQLEELKEKNSQLEHQLKEKDRALGYQNIHNLHQGKSPRSNSPDGSLANRINRKAASLTELTQRDRAKFYSEKQQADLHKQKKLKELKDGKKLQKQTEAKGKNVAQMSPQEFSFPSTSGTLEDTCLQRDKENKNAVLENTDRTAKMLNTESGQQNADGSVKVGTSDEKVKAENLQEQEAKRRRERQEVERNNTREIQEKLWYEKKDAEQKEGKKQEYNERLESDLVLQAERRKKDELLKRLKSLDEGNITTTGTLPSAAPLKSNGAKLDDLSFITTTRNINKFSHEAANKPHVEKQRNWQTMGNESEDYQPSSGPTRGHKNLNSKPPFIFDDDEPSIKISSNSSSNSTTRQNDKRTNLLESLFGRQVNSPSTKKAGAENDTFSITKTPSTRKVDEEIETLFSAKSPFSNNQSRKTSSTFPWENNTSKTNISIFDSDKESAILDVGFVPVNDLSEKKGKIQPPQQRQQKSHFFSAKPSVTAIENFDDDIEEVAL